MQLIYISDGRTVRAHHRSGTRAWTVLAALVALAASIVLIAPLSAQAQERTVRNVVYITTNDPTRNQNAVLAFNRNADCSLNFLGRFQMRGTGVGNPNFRLGTLDSDQSLVVSPDRRFLFAVNSGSDTIAVFSIRRDGTLRHVPGSPFPSGGHFPATVGFLSTDDDDDDRDSDSDSDRNRNRRKRDTIGFLFVAHKNEVPGEDPRDFPRPNYTSFRVNSDGSLTQIPGSTIRVPQGSSPTQTLVSNDGRFVFSTDLLVDFPRDFFPTDGFPAAPGAGGGGTLRSFVIRNNGRLDPNAPIRLPGPDANFPDPLGLLSGTQHISGTTNGALGLQDHPTRNILYVGFPLRFQLGVYTWNRQTGELRFRNVVGNSGQVICWVQVSEDGRFLYTTNQLDSTVSAYSLSDPLNPVEIDFEDLRLASGATMGGLASQEALTPNGRCLYAIEQRITDAAQDGSANALHILRTANGNLSEPFAPFNLADLGVSRTARPQGIAAF